MTTITFDLDSNLHITSSTPELTQYTYYNLEIDAPFDSSYILSMNIIRPDGFKTSEVMLTLMESGYWKGRITPYHTAPIPEYKDVGTMIMNFTVRNTTDTYLSSPLLRVPVNRAIEPDEETIPYSVQVDLLSRVSNIEDTNTNHRNLTLDSRFAANQHSIDSILGLKPKVEVHIDEEEPISQKDTWYDVIGIDIEVPSPTKWETLGTMLTIEADAVIELNYQQLEEPKRLVVIGNVDDEEFRQEILQDDFGFFSGEIIILIESEDANIASVEIVLERTSDTEYVVSYFESTGNIEIFSFIALSIEVYR
jgi:hypothetical protein